MPVVGVAEVEVRPVSKGAQREIAKQFGPAAEKAGTSAGRSMGTKLGGALKVGALAAGGAVIGGLGVALTKGFGRLQQIENARAKLTGLGHSAKTVEQIMTNANAAVKGTAFGLGDAASAAASAVASGVKPGKDLERTLKLTGDAASIAGVEFGDMSAIMGKAAASNKVQGDILAQLGDMGIPIVQLLGKEMKLSAEDVYEAGKKGQITFANLQNAIEDGMGGAALKSGETMKGAFNNTIAAVGRIGANLLSGVYPKIQQFFSNAITWLKPLEEGAKVAGAAIGDFIGRATNGVKGLYDLLIKGQFTKAFRTAFNVEEDSAVVDFLFRVRDGIKGIYELVVNGNFSSAFRRAFGVEEDSKIVDFLFNVRDGFIALIDYVRTDVVKGLQDAWAWLGRNQWVLYGLAGAVTGAAIAFGALSVVTSVTAWIKAATIAFRNLNLTLLANPIVLIVAAIGALVGALVWLYRNNETARKIMDAAWLGIKTAVQVAWKVISAVIKFAWNYVIMPIFNAIKWYITNVVGPIFSWLYNNIVKPIWFLISTAIKIAWAVISTIFLAIKWYIQNVVAPIFRWIYNNVIKPVWDKVGKHISTVWNKGIKPIFQALGAFIEKHVAPAFRKGVDAISRAWAGIKSAAAKPINFVIDTVYNNGLRKALNKVRKIVGGDPLPALPLIGMGSGSKGVATSGGPMRAFAKGGFASKGWALVGEEGPELVNFTNPGRVYTAAETGKMLSGKEQMPMDALEQGQQAHKGIGGFWSDAVKKGMSFVRGGLASAAGMVLKPIKSALSSAIGGTGFGRMASSLVGSTIDKALSWIAGKDVVTGGAGGSFVGGYDGPLGRFFRPGGPITSGFGSSRGRYPHAGIDFAVPIGTAVKAMFDGIVSKIGWNSVAGRSGKGEVLTHANGMNSYYGHLSGWATKPGDRVKAGQTIAYSGNTGNSTGPHLHAELWKNGQPFNFASYLHDSGGVLNPGLSAIMNNTRKPEAILNSTQWSDIHKLATVNATATTGPVQSLDGATLTLQMGSEMVLAKVVNKGVQTLSRGKKAII